jgi:hypothetical protein
MSKRKNLNDVIHGDRSDVRGGPRPMTQDETDDFFAERKSGKVTALDQYDFSKIGYSRGSSGGSYKRCYHTHPALMLPGTDKRIYGGSCEDPSVKDANIYIGFTNSMRWTERHWPWKKGAELSFYIPDMGIPSKPEEFHKLVKWTKTQVDAGHKVHCGCMGGHGRTGMFLAALVSLYGEKDAIAYVRKNYCHKAVESTKQVNFLMKEFGVATAIGSKETGGGYHTGGTSRQVPAVITAPRKSILEKVNPLAGKGSIWDVPATCN